MRHVGARQRKDRLDHLHHVGLRALDRRPLRRRHHDAVTILELHRCEVRRGLHQPRNRKRHGNHAIGNTHQRVDQPELRPCVEHLLDLRHLVQRDPEIRLPEAELRFEIRGEQPVAFHEIVFQARRNAEDRVGLARDRIPQVAPVEIAQPKLARLHPVPQEPRNRLVRIDAPLVDVVPRVAAQQVRNVHPEKGVVLRRRLHRAVERRDRVDAPRATDEQFALVLRIEVDEVFAREHPLAQFEGPRQARLLVHREERFQRPVLHRRVQQHGQSRRHPDAAVRTQRRPLGLHPLAVDPRADRVVLEVELHVRVLLAHHVHVRLQDHRRAVLVTRRRRLAHHHVPDGVLLVFDVVPPGEIDQKFDDPALLLRGAGNLRDRIELLPHQARFQSRNC